MMPCDMSSRPRLRRSRQRQCGVDGVADLVAGLLAAVKVLHDGVPPALCEVEPVFLRERAAGDAVAPEVLPGVQAAAAVVHTVEEYVHVRVALRIAVPHHHILGVLVAHHLHILACDLRHAPAVEQGSVLLHEAEGYMSDRFLHFSVGLSLNREARVYGVCHRARKLESGFTAGAGELRGFGGIDVQALPAEDSGLVVVKAVVGAAVRCAARNDLTYHGAAPP